ncbi:DUF4870 domain-containing protein [Methanocaldococcus sp. 10A]
MMKNIIDENGIVALAYISSIILWIIGPIIILLIFKSEYIKFHALQSLLFNIQWFLLGIIIYLPLYFYIGNHWFDGDIIAITLNYILFEIGVPIFNLIIISMLLFGTYKAWKGEKFKFPIIGYIVEKILYVNN